MFQDYVSSVFIPRALPSQNRFCGVVSLYCNQMIEIVRKVTIISQLSTIISQFLIFNLRRMARSVTYSVAPRINPREKDEAPKYYGRVQANGDINVREMSERIQQSCTVHKTDVQAVLVALEDVIIDALKGGEIVRLGDLGTFQIGISSKGALTEEDYDVSLIKKARINFRPGVALSGILTGLTYKKVAIKTVKKEEEENPEAEE